MTHKIKVNINITWNEEKPSEVEIWNEYYLFVTIVGRSCLILPHPPLQVFVS
jgi:hypothetical protein